MNTADHRNSRNSSPALPLAVLSILTASPALGSPSDTPPPHFGSMLAKHGTLFLNLAVFFTIAGLSTIIWGARRQGKTADAPVRHDPRFLRAGTVLLVLAALSAILALLLPAIVDFLQGFLEGLAGR